MPQKEKILYSLSLLFFATFYMPSAMQTINGVVIGLLVLYSLFFTSWKDKWRLLKERKHIVAMLLFMTVVVISLFASENQNKGWRYLDSRLALFYFPISVGLIHTRKELRNKVLLGFALVTMLASVVLLAYGTTRSNTLGQPELLYADSLTELIERQAVHISLLVTLAIFICGYYLVYLPKPKMQQALLIGGTVLLFITHILLASRNMMAVLYLSVLGFLFYYVLQKKQYVRGAILLTTLVIGIILVFVLFPKTANRFKELAYTQYDYQHMGPQSHYNREVSADQWNGANFRLAAWSCGWEIFKRHPIVGVDLGDKEEELFNMYAEKDFRFALQERRNVHSNYLDILYSMGLIGFTTFLLAWVILPLWQAWRYRDRLAALFILTIAVAMITEIYFDRNIGGMIIGFFIPFVLSDKKKNEPPFSPNS